MAGHGLGGKAKIGHTWPMRGHTVHGDQLRTIRESKAMSRADLVKASGVSLSYLKHIELDGYQPSDRIVRDLAEGLQVDPSAFCTPTDEPVTAGTR